VGTLTVNFRLSGVVVNWPIVEDVSVGSWEFIISLVVLGLREFIIGILVMQWNWKVSQLNSMSARNSIS
jgi:hypothetical protein